MADQEGGGVLRGLGFIAKVVDAAGEVLKGFQAHKRTGSAGSAGEDD